MANIEVTADMNGSREKLSKDTINLLRYSIEDYRSFVLAAIKSKDKCGTMYKCHAEVHIR